MSTRVEETLIAPEVAMVGHLAAIRRLLGGKPGELRYEVIDVDDAGDNEIVRGKAGFRIVVLSYSMIAAAPVTAHWRSRGGKRHTGPMPVDATGGLADLGTRDVPLWEGQAGQDLLLNLGAGIAVGGRLTYIFEE